MEIDTTNAYFQFFFPYGENYQSVERKKRTTNLPYNIKTIIVLKKGEGNGTGRKRMEMVTFIIAMIC